MKTVILSKTASSSLQHHGTKAEAALDKVLEYAVDPSRGENNVKALKGSEALRLRVGDFRVLFVESEDEIVVLDIGPRGAIYR